MSQPIDMPAFMVSTAELCAELEQVLSRHCGGVRRIVELDRRPAAARSSFVLEQLDAHLQDGTTLQLIFKDVSPRGILEVARQAKPSFLYDPLREIEVYQTILASVRLGTATCYGAVADQRKGHYWLFLEKVPGLELYNVGMPIWQEVARWLATMHTCFARKSDVPMRAEAHLLSYHGGFYRLWMERARAFTRRAGLGTPAGIQCRIDWLAERYERVVERLVTLPKTFIHGEFYASNILVQGKVDALRVCPVDWEMAAIGPGLIDLAALTAGSWTEEEKMSLAMAYYTALAPEGGTPLTPDAFLTALDCCHLYLAVQWLGWSQEWSPPPEHAQNWLSEALRLAEKLGW